MFQRFFRLCRGFFGLFLSGVEKRNPEALLELEKDRLRQEISRYNEGLAAHAALCERLMTQGKNLETEERESRAKAAAYLRSGNRAAAGDAALRLQNVRQQLTEKSHEMEQAETTYKQLLTARESTVRAAQEKLATLKQQIDDLKIRRATAEMAEMAAGLTNKLGGGGDTLDRLAHMVQEERDLAAGRTRVARDSMPAPETASPEENHRALADQALADFMAREGLAHDRPALPFETGER